MEDVTLSDPMQASNDVDAWNNFCGYGLLIRADYVVIVQKGGSPYFVL